MSRGEGEWALSRCATMGGTLDAGRRAGSRWRKVGKGGEAEQGLARRTEGHAAHITPDMREEGTQGRPGFLPQASPSAPCRQGEGFGGGGKVTATGLSSPVQLRGTQRPQPAAALLLQKGFS